jgi:hypothetical protein
MIEHSESWKKLNPFVLVIQSSRAHCMGVLLCFSEHFHELAGQDECLITEGTFEFLGETMVHTSLFPFWKRRRVFFFKHRP